MHKKVRRSEIDGLRAIAVLPILLFHADLLKGGYLGVDIFFIISGYLITGIIVKDLDIKSFSFAKFYEHRVRRILPMLFVLMLLCLPFAWILMNARQLAEFARSMLAAEFFISNFYFAHNVDYFSQAKDLLPLLHTWSLGVEEQYYLLWPLVLNLIWKFCRRYLLLILIFLTISSLLLAQVLSIKAPVINFYLLPSRVWQLMSGAILAYLELKQGRTKNNFAQKYAAICGLILIFFSILLFEHGEANPNLWTIIPAAGTLLIIWYAGGDDLGTQFLNTKILVTLGLISYSIYLWHQPILAFARLYNLGSLPQGMLYAYIPVTIILSYLSWRYVEQPFQNRDLLQRRQVLCILGILALYILSAGLCIISYQGFPSRSKVPQQIRDTIRIAENFEGYKKIGNLTRSKIDFFVLGDSHVQALLPALDAAAKKNNKLGIVSKKNACFPTLVLDHNNKDKHECVIRNMQALDYIVEHDISQIIWIGRWQNILQEANLLQGKENFQNNLAKAVNLYRKHNLQIQILLQTPEQIYDANFIYPRIYSLPSEIRAFTLQRYASSKQNHLEKNIDIISLMEPYLQENAKLFDPTNLTCTTSICPIGTVNESYYYDKDHLSIIGSKRLIPIMDAMLK